MQIFDAKLANLFVKYILFSNASKRFEWDPNCFVSRHFVELQNLNISLIENYLTINQNVSQEVEFQVFMLISGKTVDWIAIWLIVMNLWNN